MGYNLLRPPFSDSKMIQKIVVRVWQTQRKLSKMQACQSYNLAARIRDTSGQEQTGVGQFSNPCDFDFVPYHTFYLHVAQLVCC
mmetsp:Transcript_29215/g.53818  ORF Transcript_29215/g.53818 Transcript_29215/m.53818 type:complete len:84 (+) Transcript_29215:166-417(+)